VKSPLLVCSILVAYAGLSACQKSEVTAAAPVPGLQRSHRLLLRFKSPPAFKN
jgi:hypothetical protein